MSPGAPDIVPSSPAIEISDPLSVSQCDTDVPKYGQVKDKDARLAAYKHFVQRFKADAANYRSGNGNRDTITERLIEAASGINGYYDAASDQQCEDLAQYLEKFRVEVNLTHGSKLDLMLWGLIKWRKYLMREPEQNT